MYLGMERGEGGKGGRGKGGNRGFGSLYGWMDGRLYGWMGKKGMKKGICWLDTSTTTLPTLHVPWDSTAAYYY